MHNTYDPGKNPRLNRKVTTESSGRACSWFAEMTAFRNTHLSLTFCICWQGEAWRHSKARKRLNNRLLGKSWQMKISCPLGQTNFLRSPESYLAKWPHAHGCDGSVVKALGYCSVVPFSWNIGCSDHYQRQTWNLRATQRPYLWILCDVVRGAAVCSRWSAYLVPEGLQLHQSFKHLGNVTLFTAALYSTSRWDVLSRTNNA